MQEAIILLVSLSLLDLWMHDIIIPFVLREYCTNRFKGRLKRIAKSILNQKPFNCERCMSFWIGLILSILCMNIVFLLLPLLTKIKNRLI